jgi:hypothetical protein
MIPERLKKSRSRVLLEDNMQEIIFWFQYAGFREIFGFFFSWAIMIAFTILMVITQGWLKVTIAYGFIGVCILIMYGLYEFYWWWHRY